MDAIILFILKVAWYYLPIGIANMMPVVFRRLFNFLALPLDFNKTFLGQPIFGNHKTFRGLLFGTLAGGLIFIIQRHAFEVSDFFHNISIFDYSKISIWFGLVMGFGAILGDLIKSFFKRRFLRSPGRSWFPFDQIDYTLGGMILSFMFYVPESNIFVSVVILGVLLHIAANAIGRLLGFRRGVW